MILKKCQLLMATPTIMLLFLLPFVRGQVLNEGVEVSALKGSCWQIKEGGADRSGVYQISSGGYPFLVYCDMDSEGGGWTLVWSNLRGGSGKATTDMHWGRAINTLPQVQGWFGQTGTDLESFEYYIGLKYWVSIANAGDGEPWEMMYEWAHNFGQPRVVNRRAVCKFALAPSNMYTITFPENGCSTPVGNELPGIVTYSNGRPLSTIDVDNDGDSGSCSGVMSGTPWWYGSCWDGSISGGGERSGAGYPNGAYWKSSQRGWGNAATGHGAGNGWIWIR